MKARLIVPFIILCLILFPCGVNAESSDIELKSITLISKNGKAEEVSAASINESKIVLDLSLSKVGDSLEYNLVISNTSNEDYYLENGSSVLNTDYLEYRMDYTNESNVIEAGKETTIKLTVVYKNQVPDSMLVNDVFTDTNSLVITLSNKEVIITPDSSNPETNDVITYFMLIGLLSLILLFALRNKKSKKYIALIVGLYIFIPTVVYALHKYNITVEASIEFKKPAFSGTIYRFNNERAYDGFPMKGEALVYYAYGENNYYTTYDNAQDAYNGNAIFSTEYDCVNDYEGNPCRQGYAMFDVGEYITEEDYPNYEDRVHKFGENFYLKNVVEENIITDSFLCFVADKEYCVNYNPETDYVQKNLNMAGEFQNWFNLPTIDTYPTQNNHGCEYFKFYNDLDYSQIVCYGGHPDVLIVSFDYATAENLSSGKRCSIGKRYIGIQTDCTFY